MKRPVVFVAEGGFPSPSRLAEEEVRKHLSAVSEALQPLTNADVIRICLAVISSKVAEAQYPEVRAAIWDIVASILDISKDVIEEYFMRVAAERMAKAASDVVASAISEEDGW